MFDIFDEMDDMNDMTPMEYAEMCLANGVCPNCGCNLIYNEYAEVYCCPECGFET